MSHKMRTVKVNLLRAMTYVDGYYDINKGLEYAMKAYNAPSIKNDTLPQITIARMLTALNYALSRFSQACSMATEGSALAYAVGDKEAIAYFYQFIAFTKYELGDHGEAYRYFDRSIKLYKQLTDEQPHWVYVSDMFAVQLKEIQYLNDEGRHREALAKTADCKATLKRLATFPDLADGLHDKFTAQYLSVACCVLYNTGNKDKAEDGYRRMMATQYVKSDLGQNTPAIYQVLSGRYKEALERAQKEDPHIKTRTPSTHSSSTKCSATDWQHRSNLDITIVPTATTTESSASRTASTCATRSRRQWNCRRYTNRATRTSSSSRRMP